MTWSFLARDRPFGLAHRGGNGDAPENTVAAFANAVSLGYRYLETDVHRTADGVLVAFHDDELERVAGLPGGIEDYTCAQLIEVRLGDGHGIPRLADLLEAFPDAHFNIDPKADDAVDLLVETIREFEAIGRVCVGSFSERRITRVREALGPELCTSPGPNGVVKVLSAAIGNTKWRPPYGCLQIPVANKGVRLDRPWLIRRVQAMGLQVHFWTINDRDEMERLLDAGADAIISDEIGVLKDTLESRGGSV